MDILKHLLEEAFAPSCAEENPSGEKVRFSMADVKRIIGANEREDS